MKETREVLEGYSDHDFSEGIMEALQRLLKYEETTLLNGWLSRIKAMTTKEEEKTIRYALEMVFNEEEEPKPQPRGYLGVRCFIGNIPFPRAPLHTTLPTSFITFTTFKKLRKAEMIWGPNRIMKYHCEELKIYGMIKSYHVHIGRGFYALEFKVVKHMNPFSTFGKHDLVFGKNLLFTTTPRFNRSKTPLRLRENDQIEVSFFEEEELPSLQKEEVEEGEFVKEDYVESDGELEEYMDKHIEPWFEDMENWDEEKFGFKEEDATMEDAMVKEEQKATNDGIPVVCLLSDDEDMESQGNNKRSQGDHGGEKFVHYPKRIMD